MNVRVAGIEPSSVRQILVLQTFSYGLSDQVNMQFKMPTYNVFQTPYGFSKFEAMGDLSMSQKAPFALGSQDRRIGFEDSRDNRKTLAEELLHNDFRDLIKRAQSQNTTLEFDVRSQMISPASAKSGAIEISLDMQVPPQQPIRVNLPWLETFKLAYLQYVSFFILAYLVLYKCILGYAFERRLMGTMILSEVNKLNRSSAKVKTA